MINRKTKYLLIALLMFTLNGIAQSHKTQIAGFRKTYMDDFLKDKNSPLKQADLEFLRFYDADSTYRVEAKAEIMANKATFIMPVFSGSGSEYVPYALLKFSLKGKPMQLTVYRSTVLARIPAYKDYLFLPFTDETNGKETYPGGRYIDLREADFKNSTLVLDLNKAYNPYCAFGGGYSCPKPPAENHLAFAVQAGEKLYGRAH